MRYIPSYDMYVGRYNNNTTDICDIIECVVFQIDLVGAYKNPLKIQIQFHIYKAQQK